MLVKGETKDYPKLEAGSYPARLVSIIYLGTQKTIFDLEKENKDGTKTKILDKDGQPIKKTANQIRLTFEVINEDTSFLISGDYTLSFNNKATLRKLFENILGIKWLDEEVSAGIEPDQFLNIECLLQVGVNKNGYNIIMGASTLPKINGKKMEVAGATKPPFIISWLPQFKDEGKIASLPSFVQAKINSAPEYSKEWNENGTEKLSENEAKAFMDRQAERIKKVNEENLPVVDISDVDDTEEVNPDDVPF